MAAKSCFLLLLLLLGGCAVFRSEDVTKIALLAPFEGRYREVGYNALYAARLAFADSGTQTIDLYPVDDGGSVESAAERAAALRQDPAVKFVLLVGIDAADEMVQQQLTPHPIVIVGHWNSTPTGEHTVMLASRLLDALLEEAPATDIVEAAGQRGHLIGSELLALQQFTSLRDDTAQVEIVTSAQLPDPAFTARYGQGDPFAPEPGLLATLTYDATRIAIHALQEDAPLDTIRYEGINGVITFRDGYWQEAPVRSYRYAEGQLVPSTLE